MATNVKVLVTGSFNGQLKQGLAKVASFNKKAGPFDMLLCTGDFFGKASSEDVDALVGGRLKVPIPTYIISGKHSLPQAVIDVVNRQDGEICENLVYLGKHGKLATAQGVTIAFLSGVSDPNGLRPETKTEPDDASANPSAPDYADAAACYSQNAVSALTSHQKKGSGIDILLTSEWPEGITRNSSAAKSVPADAEPAGSQAVADIAKALQPRYHFAGGVAPGTETSPPFFEREPYNNINGAAYATRFLGLGDFGAPNKAKWYYAFNIVPMSKIDEAVLNTQVPNTTENPFIAAGAGRKRQLDLETTTSGVVNPMAGISDMPKDEDPHQTRTPATDATKRDIGFKIVPQKTLHQKATSATAAVNPVIGTEIVLKAPVIEEEAKEAQGGTCWFCLSNPDLEKHLIISIGSEVYVALAKGGLLDWGGHVLIVPIAHYPSSRHMRALEGDGATAAKDSLEEVEKINQALVKTFEGKGMVTVVFELFGGGRGEDGTLLHMHEQVIPLPAELKDDIGPAFHQQAEAEGLIPVADYPDDLSIPFCRVSYPSPDDDGETKTVIFIPSVERMEEHWRRSDEAIEHGRRPPRLMNLQFGRLVCARLLGAPERADWKACVLNMEEEKKLAESMRKVVVI
ncbi:hypothetical protein HDV00_012278 [Rhizophlyctis rosea]|nr:hypothetical protein HDV00_012278 [Rhizophlyctis rosea]